MRFPQRSKVFNSGITVLASSASCWNPALADQFTDIGEFTGGPIGVVTRDAFGQDRIEQELVDVRARYRLVEHCMGAMRSRVGDGLLGNISHDRPFSSLRG